MKLITLIPALVGLAFASNSIPGYTGPAEYIGAIDADLDSFIGSEYFPYASSNTRKL
jgi:hypothetical protein